MERGYFALYRKFQDHPFWKESRKFSKAEAWIDILWEAQHDEQPRRVTIGLKVLICNYGESLKSTRTWARRWGWGEAKVFRFFKLLKKMSQIECRNETVTTRITVLNYKKYDPKQNKSETQAEQLRNSCETVAGTDKNEKNEKNEKKTKSEEEVIQIPYRKIVKFLNQKAGTTFRPTTKLTQSLIQARWNEGFLEEDFYFVIENKVGEWATNPEMVKYLRPATLFGPKFESYLQKHDNTKKIGGHTF